MFRHLQWDDTRRVARILLAALAGTALICCNRRGDNRGGYPVLSTADCLPDVTLIDQDGHDRSLASLKGTPVLFDFIYTSCPGPCLALTAQMKAVARQLGPELGTTVRFVSVTVDPEHDRPAQLLAYARQQRADIDGWFFLTGTPEQIERFMARFKLRRQRESNGTIQHVLEFFLVGADGHPLLQYMAARTDPARIAGDLKRLVSGQPLVEGNAAVVEPALARRLG